MISRQLLSRRTAPKSCRGLRSTNLVRTDFMAWMEIRGRIAAYRAKPGCFSRRASRNCHEIHAEAPLRYH